MADTAPPREYRERLVVPMKFDYRGIVARMKNTLEQIYLRAGCHAGFSVLMIVFDTRVEDVKRGEYQTGDMIRVVSSMPGRAVGVNTVLEYLPESDRDGETLSASGICEAFKLYCTNNGSAVFSDIYPIFASGYSHGGFLLETRSKTRPGQPPATEESYQKCLIAVRGESGYQPRDSLFTEEFPCFYGTFYDLITIEYLKTFATGVANNLFSQSASLPVNIISMAGAKYISFWELLISPGGQYGSPNDLAVNINRISELEYEMREISGNIIFCDHEFPDEYTLVKFKNPYSLSNHKLVRKLIQIVDSGYCLGATRDKIYGILSDEQVNAYRSFTGRLFSVRFVRERIWKLEYIGNLTDTPFTVFLSEYENYRYSKRKLDEEHIARVFSQFNSSADTDAIIAIISSAIKQRHGTMIVFSTQAKQETERLGKTCIPLKTPINLGDMENSRLVQFITSIDGAVMCDETGVCYAIGVILDGFTSLDIETNEDISRGARYNSACRYLYKNQGKCVIVIISEDGDISLI